MGYKIIDNYSDARRLYDEGLLWYSPMRPDSFDPLFKYPVPRYYMPNCEMVFRPETGIKYAIYLEE